LPTRLGALARFAGARRALVQRALPAARRRAFWERFFSGPASTKVLRGEEPAAEAEFARELNALRSGRARARGEVYLIGAGPGDPDLLTLRALQLLQQCDVILHDRLVSPAVLERARRDAERVCVGKEPGGSGTAQEQIGELMVGYAQRGLRVARLKGGDPFIFGRGGEEIHVLIRERIPFTVVPGITAGLAAAAATATPLTQRDLAQSVTFATGHFAEDDRHDWQGLARPHQTVVFYMGVSRMEYIVSKLLDAGAPRARPALVVMRASLPDQRSVRGTLGELPALARAAQISAPALLIIGEAVSVTEPSTLAESAPMAPILDALRGVA
jgi:uroporphyrin-III C-methyltransferase/precorrin-2 dehydrogenase/sirohydrochlorin ferrochelatase